MPLLLLAAELAQDEQEWFASGQELPVWSPYDVVDAAQTMLTTLAEAEATNHAP